MVRKGCLVSGDANRLQQIFWNLFSNAVKFTPEGGTVRVEIKEKKQQVRVSVTDSGSGITAEFLPYIFDRFRQADGSTTRIHGGLGLGLSIVKHLVQLHGGTVEVKSDGQGKGSTFIVTLPLLATGASLAQEANGAAKADGNGAAPGLAKVLKGLRILVVDDEADSRDLVSAILTRCGSDVNCCDSAAAGMKAFKSWKPDLLVSDIGMPVEDGYSLIKKVRKLKSKRAREIPAIALTAYATKEDRARTLSSGFQMHVAKPIDPEKLITSVAKAMGSKV
jgi:CheY-like chemotaxis protein/anti-sigma regulatory factor (Ser/Thr protein kinase)